MTLFMTFQKDIMFIHMTIMTCDIEKAKNKSFVDYYEGSQHLQNIMKVREWIFLLLSNIYDESI